MEKDKPSRARRSSRLNRRRTLRSKNDEIAAVIPRAFPNWGKLQLRLARVLSAMSKHVTVSVIFRFSHRIHHVAGILESSAVFLSGGAIALKAFLK